MTTKIKSTYVMEVLSATAIVEGIEYDFTYNLSEGYFNNDQDWGVMDRIKRYEIETAIEKAIEENTPIGGWQ